MAHTDQQAAAYPTSFARRATRGSVRFSIPAAIVWLVLAANPRTARAQLPSLVELTAQYAPPADLGSGQPTHVQISSGQLALNVPIRLSRSRFLIPGLTDRVDRISYAQMPVDGSTRTTFHAPELSALFVQLLPNRWSATVRASGSLTGGFETIEPRTIRYSMLALVNRSTSDRLTLGGGVLATGGFGKILPLPVVSLQWKPINEVKIEVFVPAFASVRYTAWNRVELGARVEVTGNAYAIRDAHTADRWPCVAQPADDPATSPNESMANPGACLDHVAYTVASAGVFTGVRLTSTIWLAAFGGISFYRHAEVQNRDGDSVPGGAQDLPRALFVRTSLAWRLPGS